MVRMSPESYREQVRVNKTALRKGVSFKRIGMSYIKEYRKEPERACGEGHLCHREGHGLCRHAEGSQKANDVTGTLTHILEGLPTDCSVCALKDVCRKSRV